MALVAGITAVQGRVMGHAGAFSVQGEGNAQDKIKALEKAGVIMTDHPSKFGETMRGLLLGDRSLSTSVSLPDDCLCSPDKRKERVQSIESDSKYSYLYKIISKKWCPNGAETLLDRHR
jgi:hypothetical protein